MPQPVANQPRNDAALSLPTADPNPALARVTGFLLFARALQLPPDKLTAVLLRVARSFQDVSQLQLGKIVGLPVFKIWSFENAQAVPTVDEWARLIKALDLLAAVDRAARTLEDTSPRRRGRRR